MIALLFTNLMYFIKALSGVKLRPYGGCGEYYKFKVAKSGDVGSITSLK